MKRWIKGLAFLAALFLVLYVGVWQWGFCREYVSPGEMLVLTSKFGNVNPDPDHQRVVDEGVQGIQREVRGEGRHFYSPLFYNRDASARVIVVGPDEIGVVKSLTGTAPPEGEFLVGAGQKGIQRDALTPGTWRLNPFAAHVDVVKAVHVKPGYVGCVTALAGRDEPADRLSREGERGVQERVLQPGLYYLNPKEFNVAHVEIGYLHMELSGVSFPSKDSFTISLDVSVVYGLLPNEVPHIIKGYGNIDAVRDKIIMPQVESILRIEGSKYAAMELIEGDTRERFQRTFTEQLQLQAHSRHVDILIGLVRDINVPIEVREPIQKSKIAVEEQRMKEQQQTTQVVQNELEEIKADVEKGVREVAAETEKIVAETRASGERSVAGIDAQMQLEVARIMKEVADVEAERERTLGRAAAQVTELLKKAEADRFKQNVGAMGNNPGAYANYIFALGLPADLRIDVRYAGEGTFWTDLPFGRDSTILDAAARKTLTEKK